MGRDLADQCTNEVNTSMLQCQQELIEIFKSLFLASIQNELYVLIPCKKFDLSYDLNCHKLCSDFQEDIVFRFSLGWSSLVHRFLGPTNAQRVLLGLSEPIFQVLVFLFYFFVLRRCFYQMFIAVLFHRYVSLIYQLKFFFYFVYVVVLSIHLREKLLNHMAIPCLTF